MLVACAHELGEFGARKPAQHRTGGRALPRSLPALGRRADPKVLASPPPTKRSARFEGTDRIGFRLLVSAQESPPQPGVCFAFAGFITWPSENSGPHFARFEIRGGPGIGGDGSSQNFRSASVADLGETFLSTIFAGASPVANMSVKTSCAMRLLILPPSQID